LSKPVLAIDIGSTKICAVIAEVSGDDIQIIGHGIAKSQGVKKGIITNIELASKSIRKALNDARRIAGNNISTATVSISNAYAKSMSSTGVVNIPQKDISTKEINRLMETALYNANIPNEYEVIHVLPYNFRVDEQDFIEDPYGMNASRLEVDANIILTQKTSLSNLKKTVRSAGLEIEGIVLNSYASSIAVLQDDEKELGVALIDMGGQTSNLIIHIGNSIRYNSFLGVGSNHITNDLSMALHTPLQIAENVKIRHGDLVNGSHEVIELPVIGDEESRNSISLEMVHNVIMARVEESLSILANTIEKSALSEQIGAGIVLTGGMTKLKGIRELAQAIFRNSPIRIGYPKEIGGLIEELKDPAYATVIGLLLYQAGGHTQYEIDNEKNMLHSKSDIPEVELGDIRLDEHSRNEHSQESHRKRENSVGNKVLKELHPDEDNDTFSFDDLPRPDTKDGTLLSKITNWAKQLF